MTPNPIRCLALACTLLLAGCSEPAGDAGAAGTAAAPAPAATSATAAPAPAATSAPAAPASPASTAAVTGVAECDDFLAAYEQCVAAKMPEQARPQMQAGLLAWKDSWKQLAAQDSTRAALPAACKQAREASVPALQAYGCTL